MTFKPAGLLTRMLREAFDGPPGPWTYFTDTMVGAGVFGTIDELTAAEASALGGPGHTTIAGHIHHVSESLALACRELAGETVSRDRSRSWTVTKVDEAEWAAQRARIRDEYEKLLATVKAQTLWDEETIGLAMGAVAHTAYHLGAIRQRVRTREHVSHD